jgi:low affinity Fe/Cu permease
MTVRTQPDDKSTALTRTIGNITGWLGSFPAILLSFLLVGMWFLGVRWVNGGFSNDSYQLVINTGTTIVTFWMVFIIQNTQNREGRAMQAKLDAQSEIIRAIADRLGVEDDDDLLTRLVGVEDAPERIIKEDQDKVRRRARATGETGLTSG